MSVHTNNRFAALSSSSNPSKQPQPKSMKSKTAVQEMKKVAATIEKQQNEPERKKRDGDKPARGRGNNRGGERGRGGYKPRSDRNPEDKPKREGGAPRRGRKFDRHSGTGRNPNETKKGNHGKGNWGSVEDTVTVEKEALVNAGEPIVGEPEPNVQVEEEVDNTLSLAEVMKQREDNRPKFDLPAARVVEEDDTLKQKFTKLEKKAPEGAPKAAKKKENKASSGAPKKQSVAVQITMKEDRPSNRGRGGRGNGGGNRGGKQGRTAYTVKADDFPALS